MSCRPTVLSRLLRQRRNSLSPPPPFLLVHLQDSSVRLLPLSSSSSSSPSSRLYLPVRLRSFHASAPTSLPLEESTAEDVAVGVPTVPDTSSDASQNEETDPLVRKAVEFALKVDRIRMHKYYLMRTMYSASLSLRRHRRLRRFWFHFRSLLWARQPILPAQVPALDTYRQQAIQLHDHLEQHPTDRKRGQSPPLLSDCHPLGLLVGALSHSAKLTLSMLDFLHCKGPVPFQITADCVRYLRRSYLAELEADPDLMSSYDQYLTSLRNPHAWPRHLRPSQMEILLHRLSESEMHALLLQFLDHLNHPALPPGMPNRGSHMFVLDAFVRLRDVDGALKVLAAFPPAELEYPDQELLRRIILILQLESFDDELGPGFLSVLPKLLKLGVKPIQVIQNKSIRNAIKLDLTPLAWDLVRYAQETKMEIEGSSAAALLRHSFQKQDLQRLNEIMSTIYESPALSQEPRVIMDMMNIVRLVCYYERNYAPDQSLAHLLTIYDRAYNRNFLTKVGILGPSSRAPPSDQLAPNDLPDPPPMVCAFLVWTYVYLQRHERPVTRLWERWGELIDQADPLVQAAAQYDLAFNGFLLFLARGRQSVWNVPLILAFMFDKDVCKPSQITWSLSITAYLQWRDQEHPVAQRIHTLLVQNNAKVSEKEWREYIQPRFPSLDLQSSEARQFVQFDPDSPHQADQSENAYIPPGGGQNFQPG